MITKTLFINNVVINIFFKKIIPQIEIFFKQTILLINDI